MDTHNLTAAFGSEASRRSSKMKGRNDGGLVIKFTQDIQNNLDTQQNGHHSQQIKSKRRNYADVISQSSSQLGNTLEKPVSSLKTRLHETMKI